MSFVLVFPGRRLMMLMSASDAFCMYECIYEATKVEATSPDKPMNSRIASPPKLPISGPFQNTVIFNPISFIGWANRMRHLTPSETAANRAALPPYLVPIVPSGSLYTRSEER